MSNYERHPLYDRIHNANLRDVREVAVRVIDAVQTLRPEEQISGLAATFILICERFGNFPARTALDAAHNMVMSARYRDEAHFEGLRMYLQSELKG